MRLPEHSFCCDLLKQFYNYYLSGDRIFVRNIRHTCGITPRHLFLYKLALTHSSSVRKGSEPEGVRNELARYTNERLEYLGDSILDAVVAEYLFRRYPTRDEGFLTEMRSKIVNRKSLNRICLELDLDKLLVHNQGGSLNESMYGDALEAMIGAIFLDYGYLHARRFILNRLLEPHISVSEIENEIFSYKNKLLEHVQKVKMGKLSFEVVEESGEGVRKVFKVNALVDAQVVGKGEGRNKKAAEQHAAEDALVRLQVIERV